MALLQTQTRETQRRLATTAVLLWEVDQHAVQHVSRVPRQGPEQGSVSVHHNKAIPAPWNDCWLGRRARRRGGKRQPAAEEGSRLESDSISSERASVWNLLSHRYSEVLMGLNRGAHPRVSACSDDDRPLPWGFRPTISLERLKVDVDLLLLAIVRHDGAAVHDQTVFGNLRSNARLMSHSPVLAVASSEHGGTRHTPWVHNEAID